MFRSLVSASLALLVASAPAALAQAPDVKNPEKAIKQFSEAVKKAPEDSESWYNLASAYYQAKKYQESIDAADKAVAINDKSAPTHELRGHALSALGRGAESVAAFRKALELDPTRTSANIALANAAMKAKLWDDAIEAAKAALKTKPADPNPLYTQIGTAYLKKGDGEQAAKWMERTTEGASNSPETWYNLGAAYRSIANDLGPSDASYSTLWGKSGDAYVKYLQMQPNDAIGMWFAGEALANAGRNAEAKTWISKYLAADPGGKKAEAKFGAAGKVLYKDAQQILTEL
jgi:tetratricopeptide (TPR) repeat protein